jgi:hypothetical protein
LKYELLTRNLLRIVLYSLCLIIATQVSLNALSLLLGEVKYANFYELVAREASFALLLLGLVLVVFVLHLSSSLKAPKYLLGVKVSVLVMYLYLTVLMITSGVKPELMEYIEKTLPPYLAQYLFVVILLLVAFVLTRTPGLIGEEWVVYAVGVALEVTGVVSGLLVLHGVITAMLKGNPEFALLATAVITAALAVYVWLSVESTVIRVRGVYSYSVLQSVVLRRLITIILGLAVALVALGVSGSGIVAELGRKWTFQHIREAILLVQLVGLITMSIGLVISLVGGILILRSEHGARGILILSQYKKSGEVNKALEVLEIKKTSSENP